MNECQVDECERPRLCRGFCRTHYERWRKHGDPTVSITRTGMAEVDRFWDQVDRRSDGECWPWLGSVDQGGYGVFSVRRQATRAHRYAVVLAGRALLASEVVMHSCDNPPCVNPAHLHIGTQADNIADKMAKGRHRALVGVQSHRAKLSDADVRKIRELCERGEISQARIGEMYGIGQDQVSRI